MDDFGDSHFVHCLEVLGVPIIGGTTVYLGSSVSRAAAFMWNLRVDVDDDVCCLLLMFVVYDDVVC